MRRIGVLIGTAAGDPQTVAALAVFTRGFRTDGRNIRIDYRFAAADVDRMQTFAKELVGLQPDFDRERPRRSADLSPTKDVTA
jgi:putative ABC transport system substrate-binding protein